MKQNHSLNYLRGHYVVVWYALNVLFNTTFRVLEKFDMTHTRQVAGVVTGSWCQIHSTCSKTTTSK